jgi:hypothetical protein
VIEQRTPSMAERVSVSRGAARLGWMIGGSGFGSLLLFPADPKAAFYEVAAQVLPVLLLVLAFELRAFRLLEIAPAYVPPSSRPWSKIPGEILTLPTRTLPVLALFVMIVGEIVALNSVASGDLPAGFNGAVGFALTLGLVTIAAAALTAPRRGE